jgi:hypothetical protein
MINNLFHKFSDNYIKIESKLIILRKLLETIINLNKII